KEIALGAEAQTWDEFHPNLQQLSLRLEGADAEDQRRVVFGLRELGVEDRNFTVNGHEIFLRGTLECCIFPLTGYPPTDVESWKRVLRACQAHGLNHIRFHSWCPPDAAFVAADEMGFYLSVEVAAWCTVGDGKPVDDWLYQEGARILKAYGNHPSFALMAYGNEPAGTNRVAWLTQWVTHWKNIDTRRLYTSGSGFPSIPENQYNDFYNDKNPCRGLAGWLGKDYRQSVETLTSPAIVHEMGQWCVYPNFDEIKKYTGPLKPRNFEIFRDSLTGHGMLDQAREFVRASGKLQVLCYKEEIEAALRTPGIGGFHLLDLHDFPGQGTAPVGVLDPFWEPKSYVTAQEYRRFCNRTVPLARLLKRVWTTQETLTADVEVAHFGPQPLVNAVATWKLLQKDGAVVEQGILTASPMPVPLGQGIRLGRIEAKLTGLPAPKAYRLVVDLGETAGNSAVFENDWTIWVYPAKIESPEPAGVLVSAGFDAPTISQLERGGKVLLLPAKLPSRHPRLKFEPIFWCRFLFDAGFQTLGLLCDPKHPALAGFPTEYFQDFQWQEIVTDSQAMVLDTLPKVFRPIVQPIDDWNSNRKLGLVWECRVGQGKLLVCSADLQNDLDKRPAARQLRASLMTYLGGTDFNPKFQITKECLAELFNAIEPSTLSKMGAKVLETDSEDSRYLASNIIDGNPDTIWHTRWEPTKDPLPHYVIIDMGSEVTVKGVTYLPRQDAPTGRIADADVYCSLDPKAWSKPAASAKWPNTDQRQTLTFGKPVRARYLKVVSRSEVNGFPFASMAELDILTDEK
ncbi:MAG: discoidin domain-containing protein, partial [Verrucomicrobiota bacterium]